MIHLFFMIHNYQVHLKVMALLVYILLLISDAFTKRGIFEFSIHGGGIIFVIRALKITVLKIRSKANMGTGEEIFLRVFYNIIV